MVGHGFCLVSGQPGVSVTRGRSRLLSGLRPTWRVGDARCRGAGPRGGGAPSRRDRRPRASRTTATRAA